jgi:hypothetical protein
VSCEEEGKLEEMAEESESDEEVEVKMSMAIHDQLRKNRNEFDKKATILGDISPSKPGIMLKSIF